MYCSDNKEEITMKKKTPKEKSQEEEKISEDTSTHPIENAIEKSDNNNGENKSENNEDMSNYKLNNSKPQIDDQNKWGNTTEAVLNHLLFHKSLIDDHNSSERINKYMQLVNDLEKGMLITVKDPFDKSLSIAFELIMQQHFDPWDIDLVKFTKIYLDRTRNEKNVDFITAGKLIFMAWAILKMQSDELVAKAGTQTDMEEDSWGSNDLNVFDSTEDLDYTTLVMNGVEPPLQEMLRRQGTRPVTLMELVDAFDEAKQEAEARQKMWEIRKSRYKLDVDFNSKVHKEDIGEDICSTCKRILSFNGKPIPLSDICNPNNGGKDDFITVFVSILFLAHMKKVNLTQRQIPRGEIFVQNMSHGEEDISGLIEQEVALENVSPANNEIAKTVS